MMKTLREIYQDILLEEEGKIRPTVAWMKKNYKLINDEVFYGELGDCQFEVFTTGRGSQGGVLGWFASDKNTRNGRLIVDRDTRQMYLLSYDEPGKIQITRSNFVQLFKPVIKINGNYVATEESMLNTLVHEMIHYYTYMYGKCPKQGHGPEFRQACRMVQTNSDGRFNIQRVKSAEEMQNWELDQEFKDKEARRISNKKSRITAYFVFFSNGDVGLTTTSKEKVLNSILATNKVPVRWDKKVCDKIIASNDSALIDKLFSLGYKRDFRTYRSWLLPDKLKNIVYDYDWQSLYDRNNQLTEDFNEDEYIEIIPDFNYGLESPFEQAENS